MKKKFGPAFAGIAAALQHKSVRLQFLLGALALLVGFILKLTYMEWIAFVLCIGMVLAAELLNTAVEFLCNCITTQFDSRIKTIKDISAGAVLLTAISAFVTALMIFVHHIT